MMQPSTEIFTQNKFRFSTVETNTDSDANPYSKLLLATWDFSVTRKEAKESVERGITAMAKVRNPTMLISVIHSWAHICEVEHDAPKQVSIYVCWALGA